MTTTITTPKFIIQDLTSKKYYCVREATPTNNTDGFPFWSNNEQLAYKFDTELLANHEMNCNDLTCDNTRIPVIIAGS